MKLSTDTVNILKNFSTINSGLFFKKGNKLSTVSQSKTILAQAILSDTFPKDFGVYDLNEFLSVLSVEKELPEIEFDDVNVIIKSLGGRSKTKYRVTDKAMIVTPPDKEISLSAIHTTFTLTTEDYEKIIKYSSVLHSPNIAVLGEGGILKLVCFDLSNDASSPYELNIGIATKDFRFVFKTENIKMIPGTYIVEISSSGIAHLKSSVGNIEYWVTTEKDGNIV